ncbi:caspase family protein [Pseudarthrobacter oxydans]|uniref:caspase family protein n=1 Tax=Pseudarthrobacter oxydans TaxID=1671 RepID=UPI00344F4729
MFVEYVAPDDTQTWQIEAATIDNLEAAYGRWRNRCDEDQRNVAMFYYCGHGMLLQDDHILLAEDFGAKPLKPFDAAFNFNAMRRGLEACSAGLQTFFVDACNNLPVSNLDIRESGVKIFEATSSMPAVPSPKGLSLDATAPGYSAYGDTGQVSRFTEALVLCLNGLAAKRRSGGPWVVNSYRLHEAIVDVMEYLHETKGGYTQVPTVHWAPGNGVLHECDQAPLVPVVVRLMPDDAALAASLALGTPEDAVPRWQCAAGAGSGPSGAGWVIDGVPAGKYALRADFPRGRFKPHTVEVLIEPPGPHPDPYPITCEAI